VGRGLFFHFIFAGRESGGRFFVSPRRPDLPPRGAGFRRAPGAAPHPFFARNVSGLFISRVSGYTLFDKKSAFLKGGNRFERRFGACDARAAAGL